ncbi:asparaginase [candidate division KSB1 bacterium]|nr:MAG: asparaginase [candidate division KSB1 bacterium]
MKNILLIHTGGTFGMVPTEPDHSLAPAQVQDHILNMVPEVNRLAGIDVLTPFNKDSANVGVKEWDLLSALIYEHWAHYDGFVVIHGTDTMTYTAAALSFSLRQLDKPIIMTGSQRPLSLSRSDARLNLIDAIELATLDLSEVLIVFNQKIFRGNRTKKVSIKSYDAFDSPNFAPLGEIGVTIDIDYQRMLKNNGPIQLISGFNPKLSVIPIHPSLSPEIYSEVLKKDVHVLILLGFGSGNIPFPEPDWIQFIKDALARDISVFIGSQSIKGQVDLSLYECGQQALKAGAHSLQDVTLEAAWVKLAKILHFTLDPGEIVRMFYQDWAGEI